MNNGKNRQGLAAAAALAFGVVVLAVPEAAARGFAGGTALCLQSVLPALFPFFVVCELLTDAPPPAALLRPMQQVLGLASAETARALLLSWVGGYAVCARLAGQLYGAGRITRRDAALLQVLGCCSGPGFVIGCVGGALLGNVRLGVVLYAAQIGANGIELYLGCECHRYSGMAQDLRKGILPTLAESRYVLVEFSGIDPYSRIRAVIYELTSAGFVPIIAHVERCRCMAEHLDNVQDAIDLGARIQVNAASVLGKHGRQLKRYCKKLMKRKMIDYIASDAHDLKVRPLLLRECADYVEKKWGKDTAKRIFVENPSEIIGKK